MDCKRIRVRLPDYCAGRLSGRRRELLDNHLEHCDACRRELAAFEATVRLFQTHASGTPPEGLWHGIRNRITQPEPAPRRAWDWSLFRGTPARGLALATAVASVAGI